MVKIVSDSTCDLSKELLHEFSVEILPLHIILGENDFEDGEGITPDEIYKWSDENKTTPKTAAPSMERAINCLEPHIKNGDEVICFAISEDMSSSANVMRLAAEELDASDQVHVIDSANLSTGIGLLVLEAASLAREGLAAKEIAAQIETLKPLVRASFVVDTLTYLYRGGRCSGLAAMAGGMLKLHPRIEVVDGKMGPGKKYRGKMNRVILDYAKDMEADLVNARTDRVFITHSGCPREIIDSVVSYLENLNHFDRILVTRAGGVISSHCGPGTLGVLFIANED